MNAPAEIITRRAPLASTTWNAETWTFEAVLSGGASVERWDVRGPYDEILSLSQPEWPARVPLLDSHGRESVDRQLGSVDTLRVVGGDLLGRVTLSRHNPRSQRIAAELTDGASFGISIGYSVRAWSERTNTKTGRREKVAERFDLIEASLVVVPADPRAGIRSQHMPVSPETANPPSPHTPPAATAPIPTAVADRAAVNAEIRSIATVAGLDQAWTDSQIDANATTEAARAAAFDAMRTRSAPAAQIRTTTAPTLADPAVRAAAMGEALLCRIDPAHKPSEPARAFVGLSLPELARDSMRNAGLPVTGLGASEVMTRALHSTSDFALALSDTQGRVLAASYKAAASGLKPLAREVSLPDFRARTFIRTSGISDLEKVNESGEFRRGTFDHAGESVKLATYGKVFGISRQALVNDDIGALADIPAKLGAAAARFEADQLGALLVSNAGAGPTMADAVALFHATHGNLAGAGAAPAEATLGAARLAMRAQTDDAGFLISVVPKYLVVGPALETAAEKLLAAIQPTQTSDVQPIRLTLVVEPRLAGNAWYVVDPTVDGLVYAHLAGEGGPQIESRAGFDVDGVETRVRLDFGATFIDWRGWYRNAGAA